MKTPNVRELLAKAAEAEPPANSKSKSSWAEFFPVIEKLVDKRDFSPWAATQWLVENGAIPEANRRVCYHSYLGYARRKRGRRAKATAEDQGTIGSGFDEDAAR
jgi:hypothetical protein